MKIRPFKLLPILALVTYPALGLSVAANANPSPLPVSPIELAQTNSQDCRVPNRIQDIYTEPSVDGAVSDVRRTLQANTRISVNRNPDGSVVQENGFTQVTLNDANGALTGWMISRYLTTIPGCGTTTPPENLCARVTESNLSVRRSPNETGEIIGSLSRNAIVVIRDTSNETATGRTWIQFPYRGGLGWAAETGRNGVGRNFSARYRCDR